jgi:hypothetical protein
MQNLGPSSPDVEGDGECTKVRRIFATFNASFAYIQQMPRFHYLRQRRAVRFKVCVLTLALGIFCIWGLVTTAPLFVVRVSVRKPAQIDRRI